MEITSYCVNLTNKLNTSYSVVLPDLYILSLYCHGQKPRSSSVYQLSRARLPLHRVFPNG